MLNKTEKFLNNIIVLLKLTLNIELYLNWINKVNNSNFCVAITAKNGPCCNCIVIYYKKDKIILHTNIYDEKSNSIKQQHYYIKNLKECKKIITDNINNIIIAYIKIYKGEI